MKLRFAVMTLVLLLLAVGFNLFAPSRVSAQARADDCMNSTPATIDSLELCVIHAAAQGHIDSQYVVQTLLAKLDKAEDTLADGHSGKAIWWLNAFIHEVKAQSGKHIVPVHAMHLVMHAEMVIQALQKE